MLDLKVTTILIEDSRQSLKESSLVLEKFSDLLVVGSASTGEQGLELCQTHSPLLIIVKMNLPDMNGIDFARIVRNRNIPSEIVFLANNKQYAYEALSVEPFDYLVLPVDTEFIMKMIQRFKQKLKKKELFRKMELFSELQEVSLKRVFHQKKGIVVLYLDEIIFCKAELTKTVLKLKNGESVLVKTSIIETLEIINNRNFIRTGRSYFINTKYLRKIEKRQLKCVLHSNGQTWEVPVSKSLVGALEKFNVQPIF